MAKNKVKETKPDITGHEDLVGPMKLKKGEESPLQIEPFKEEDLRFFYDENGRLLYMGGVNDDFQIRHEAPHLVQGVDSVDLGFLEEVLNSDSVKAWLRPHVARSKFFKEAFEDFFLLLVKNSADLVPIPTPSQFYLMRLLQELMTQEEFEAVSKKCTLNLTRSTLVAQTWVDNIAKMMSDEDLQMLDAANDLNEQFKDVLGNMQEFVQRCSCQQAPQEGQLDQLGRPVPGQQPGEGQGEDSTEGEGEAQPCPHCGGTHKNMRPATPKELGLTAEQARERLRELTKQFSELRQKLLEKLEQHKDKIEQVTQAFAPKGTKQASEKMNQLTSLASAAGVEEGELKQIAMDDILKLSEKYRSNKELQLLIRELGRMRKVALKAMRSMSKDVENANNKPVDLDDNISRLMPTEMVKSRHPGLRKEFRKRLLEKNVDCFDTRGPQPVNRGPVLICKDTSGSMSGAPNAWATALGLTTGFVATAQGRRYALVNFSSPGQLKVSEFQKHTPFTEQIEEASYMFNGGTCFETPLKKCAEMIKESIYDKADILFLTDGICNVSAHFLKEFNHLKKERSFKVISVLINIGYGDVKEVESFSDKVFLLSDLQDDQDVLNTAFAL